MTRLKTHFASKKGLWTECGIDPCRPSDAGIMPVVKDWSKVTCKKCLKYVPRNIAQKKEDFYKFLKVVKTSEGYDLQIKIGVQTFSIDMGGSDIDKGTANFFKDNLAHAFNKAFLIKDKMD